MIIRLLRLPFYLSALILTFLLPFVIVDSLNKGPGNYLTATILIGAYPTMLAVTNGVLIEHFIMRKLITSSLTKYYADEIAGSTPWFLQIVFFSGTYLLKLINIQRNKLSQDIIEKGHKLANRHKAFSILSFVGMLLMLIVGVGDAYLSNT